MGKSSWLEAVSSMSSPPVVHPMGLLLCCAPHPSLYPCSKFPRGFMWGTATSAYQVEGAFLDEGKGLSIWDAFCHTPGKIPGNANADVSACHFYRCASYFFVFTGRLLLPFHGGRVCAGAQ